jgi:3-oxoacyl-[acyl-carrier-protein] synthase-1
MNLRIRDYAAVTPVGFDAAATAAAVRAGIAAQVEHPFMTDHTGEPMVVALVPTLTPKMDSISRLTELALPPFLKVLRSVPPNRTIFVLLAMPEPRPGLPGDYTMRLRHQILRVLSENSQMASVSCTARGAAGGLELFGEALLLLRSEPAATVLIGGVDSHMAPETLEWWDRQDLLHSKTMPWGFCPGEAAAWCLTTADIEPGLHVASVGTGTEPNAIGSTAVCSAQGLTAAWREALARAHCPDRGITRILCDLNGEPYRAEEYGLTMLRQGRFVAEDAAFDTPARSWGDVGAAFGPLSVVLVGEAMKRGYAAGGMTLVFAGARSSHRAALVLMAE